MYASDDDGPYSERGLNSSRTGPCAKYGASEEDLDEPGGAIHIDTTWMCLLIQAVTSGVVHEVFPWYCWK